MTSISGPTSSYHDTTESVTFDGRGLVAAAIADEAADAADVEARARDRRAQARDRRARRREKRRGTVDAAAERVRLAAAADRAAAAADRARAADDRARARAERAVAEELRRWSTIDSLTGVFRREAGLAMLTRLHERALHTGETMVVAFVDVDGLKQINDSRGHGAGDDILRAVAATLTQSVRRDDVVMRYGGDEFLIGAVGLPLPDIISRLTVASTDLTGRCGATMTFGAARAQDADGLPGGIDRADAALYATRRRLRSV